MIRISALFAYCDLIPRQFLFSNNKAHGNGGRAPTGNPPKIQRNRISEKRALGIRGALQLVLAHVGPNRAGVGLISEIPSPAINRLNLGTRKAM